MLFPKTVESINTSLSIPQYCRISYLSILPSLQSVSAVVSIAVLPAVGYTALICMALNSSANRRAEDAAASIHMITCRSTLVQWLVTSVTWWLFLHFWPGSFMLASFFSSRDIGLDKLPFNFKYEVSLLVELCHDVKVYCSWALFRTFTFCYSKKKVWFHSWCRMIAMQHAYDLCWDFDDVWCRTVTNSSCLRMVPLCVKASLQDWYSQSAFNSS